MPYLVCLPRAGRVSDLIAALDAALATTDAKGPIEIVVEPTADQIVVRIRSGSGKTVEVGFESAG
jgi:hypothetical protein